MGLLLVFFYEWDQDASRYARHGLQGLLHRGPRALYAAAAPGRGVDRGEARPLESLSRLPQGPLAVAAVEPSASLAVARGPRGVVAAAVDGGCSAEQLAVLAAERGPGEAVEELVSGEAYAPCAAVAVSSEGWFLLGRGKESRRPLSLGGYGFEAVMAATESAAISLMGGSRRLDVAAGEAFYGDRFVFERLSRPGTRRTSLFEYIYMARPDSIVDGVEVYTFRVEMGRRLAASHGAEVDVVVGVPETALPYALGYARQTGAPLELGFVSTLGRVRTAVSGLDPEERLRVVSLKLNPVPSVFEAKKVAIVDDSVVTGLTMKTVVQRLRRLYGAREVHIAVASPRIVGVCPYRLQLLDPGSLVARHLSDEQIARVLDADSLAWLPLGEAVSYLRSHGIEPCTDCMRG